MESRIARGLPRPPRWVLEGNPGLRAAVAMSGPGLAVPRCVVHPLRNLDRSAPRPAREALTADDQRRTEAESGAPARQAFYALVAKGE